MGPLWISSPLVASSKWGRAKCYDRVTMMSSSILGIKQEECLFAALSGSRYNCFHFLWGGMVRRNEPLTEATIHWNLHIK